MFNLLMVAFGFASMGALGFLVWKVVSKQESRDPKFKSKLDADDERAKKGRERSGMS